MLSENTLTVTEVARRIHAQYANANATSTLYAVPSSAGA
jgi:hypothetical protein